MYDIFFLSYDEQNADKHWESLKERFPYARRIHGIRGIYEAHYLAAEKSFTKMFYVVDADAELSEDFYFDYEVEKSEYNTVHVWNSVNPVNDLVYGYGAVKLLPKTKFIKSSSGKIDVSTGISTSFKVIKEISNVTRFNSSPLHTWRSAFRECAKLSSKVIDRAVEDETHQRLNEWCTKGQDRTFGEFSIDGANKGKEFGSQFVNDKEELKKINDFCWLEEQFKKYHD